MIASVRAASLEEFSRKLSERLVEPRRLVPSAEAGWSARPIVRAEAEKPTSVVRSLPRQLARARLALVPFSARLIMRTLAAFLVLGTLTAVVARASDAVPSGEGVGSASAYAVSGVEYRLSLADPTKVDSVTFGLASAMGNGVPRQVTISVDGGMTWSPCRASGSRWTCSARTSVRQVSSLRVVAAQ